ncbi:hypothetical protein LC087_19130 (plasmid) [Bacillus carboniphilus]|uniref:Uncharacterized protein n=1 Tax=Bacillus carboniphilus TaxID=86663 RepID=A0ABY9JYG0_9BACI|nr:hypothetical protein [Bacillus carboniphilus]WLR44422.1 hypothetical protein LC087_19130 [Bacillus carboniphilus]
MIKITFIDGTHIDVNEDTVLNGYKGVPGNAKDGEFYLENVYSGAIGDNPPLLATSVPPIGIAGFLLTSDCFSVGINTENPKFYMTSAVKSVEEC